MNAEELVQEIGHEVCDGCGPDSDCGEDPSECIRVATAMGLLDDYIRQQADSLAEPCDCPVQGFTVTHLRDCMYYE